MLYRHTRPTGNVHDFTDGGRHIRCTHIGFDDIGDISEIASLLPIAIDAQWLTSNDGLAETMESHIRALPWPIDREVAQRDRWHAEVTMVQRAEVFCS